MSYDLWNRWDRVTCRVAGHSWLDDQCEWLGSPTHFSTCIRCGASGSVEAKRRHRLVRTG